MSRKIAYILLGAPGSGKGTQGEILEKKIGYRRYVMSSLIKEEIKLGKESKCKWVQTYNVEDGTLLNDLNIFELFRNKFNFENGIILDGIPRTLDQSYWLYGFLKEHKYDIKVVFLNVDENKLLDRILLRAKVSGRRDDTPEIFKERLKIYDAVKKTILEVYSEEIIEIDGDQSIDEVSNSMFKALGIE